MSSQHRLFVSCYKSTVLLIPAVSRLRIELTCSFVTDLETCLQIILVVQKIDSSLLLLSATDDCSNLFFIVNSFNVKLHIGIIGNYT